MVGGIEHLWSEWAVQILVLLSLSLQIFLFISADFRRRNASTVLRALLWLAYLAADSTGTYTIGHLSIGGLSRAHGLVPFWAPFLLLHLGGQDTITAYALEDNRLWLRHLQTLLVQALGVSYVIYRYISWQPQPQAPTVRNLVAASILMLVAGAAKYVERIWALKCTDNEGMNDFLVKRCEESYCTSSYDDAIGDLEKMDAEESILHGARTLLGLCLRMFLDHDPRTAHYENGVTSYFLGRKQIYEVVRMELSLVYDIIYTKARVVHTWYGLCTRVCSLLVVASAFLLFQGVSKDGYARADVAITYVLLVGAILVELTSGVSAICSTWTCHYLYWWRWHRLHGVIISLRRLVKARRRRAWPATIGQFNMIDYCAGPISVSETLSKVKIHQLPSPKQVSARLKDLLLDEILRIAERHAGMEEPMNALGQNPELPALDADFDARIIIWHTATSAILFEVRDRDNDSDHAEAVKVLSDYMMFLLAKHPEMLPGPNRRPVYAGALVWLNSICDNNIGPPLNRTRAELARDLLKEGREPDNPFRRHKSPCKIGAELAMDLLNKAWGTQHLLQAIFGLWVEMMCFAGSHCNKDSHIRKLSRGGEFLTIVWLLTRHLGEITRHRRGLFTL
ncbi:hypothetical protein C2845_PM06G14580 [Panicum miliaceum]|uniref:DUF4220 domain-containing protein n=1 Tax=Panicum miliaceum TaxID=4540 RepID=A0A3L6RCP7_PANMI|nr:hypothetical protein C2845_PM06G14580 [Panicum miliaceum]